jgi:radical SAM superfamily enzyme YgiQ (UPF0313 family)
MRQRFLFGEPGLTHAEGGTMKYGKQTPNIGLAYVATYARERIPGSEVKVFDRPLVGFQDEDYVRILEDFRPDIVGLTAQSFNVPDAFHMFDLAKRFNPQILTVLGGPHGITMPDLTFFEAGGSLDVIVGGEGEPSLEVIAQGNFTGPRIISVPNVKDPNSLPPPDWSMFDYENYALAPSSRLGRRTHIYNITIKRGCPYQCTFCKGDYLGTKSRARTSDHVVAEIKRNMEERGAEYFYITDSSFTLRPEEVRELCDLLIDTGIAKHIAWKTATRVDLADPITFQKMYDAGCEVLFFGLESGVNETLKRIKKNIDLEKVGTSVKMASDIGLRVTGSFIAGLPGDNIENVERSIDWAEELMRMGLEGYAFHIMDAYPGTEIWDQVMKGEHGMRWAPGINPYNWASYNRDTAMVEVNDLDVAYLNSLHERLKHRRLDADAALAPKTMACS